MFEPAFGVFGWVLVNLIFFGFLGIIILGPRYLRSRERQRLYDVMKLAYEKGQPVPPEIIAALQGEAVDSRPAIPAPDRDLRRAIVLISVGLGLAGLGAGFDYGLTFASAMAGAIVGGIIAGVGAIPGLIGVAYLILWLLSRSAHKA